MSRGRVRLTRARPGDLDAVLDKLSESGAEITCGDDWIELDMNWKRPKAVNIKTSFLERII